MKFLGGVISTVIGIFVFLAVVVLILAFAFSGTAGAQSTSEPEMWGYGNLGTGEIAVVMVMDMESPTTAEMIHSDFAEILVDEVLDEGYTETEVTSIPRRGKINLVPDGSECRFFEGEAKTFDGDVSLMFCLDGSLLYVVAGDAPDSVLWGFVEDLYEDGEPSTPKNFIDLTDQLN